MTIAIFILVSPGLPTIFSGGQEPDWQGNCWLCAMGSRTDLFFSTVSMLFLYACTAAAANDCRALRAEREIRARNELAETVRSAKSAEAKAITRLAPDFYSQLTPALVQLGAAHYALRLNYESLIVLRHFLVEQRMGQPESESFRNAFIRAQMIAKERTVDEQEYRTEKRVFALREQLARDATALATQTLASPPADAPQGFNYDRAFAYDDKKFELRMCAPPRRGVMLDRRFCAIFSLDTGQVTYALRGFASYRDQTPVQSDQWEILALGASTPDDFVTSKDGRKRLWDELLEDNLLALPSECAPVTK